MKHASRFVVLALAFTLGSGARFALAQTDSPLGDWTTIDDSTGKPRALVHISESNGELRGTIQKLFLEPQEDQHPTCSECSDARRDQPVVGMLILSGLRHEADGPVWSGGEILDPSNGKVYKSRATLSSDGRKLEVRGYIGFALLGRSQTWMRTP